MAYHFLRGDPDQPFLLPPDLRDWLPTDHLAWFVLDVVDQLDLGPFLRAYRADGHGHPAYDPKALLGVLLYAYAIGVRSSRQIERRCHEDLAFRVLAGNQTPDHVTVARFRARHEQALGSFLVESLRLCAAAGLVRLGLVALDGTKLAANAADRANRTLAKLEDEVAAMLREATETDQAEDREHGPGRGEELPADLASPGSRLARLRQAKARLEAEAAERQRRYQQRVAELAAAARAKGKQPRAPIKPRRRDEAPNPGAVANTTDPDSRFLHTRNGTVQGYNAQRWSPRTRSWSPRGSPSRPTICSSWHRCSVPSTRPWPPPTSTSGQGCCWPTPATGRSPTSPPSRMPPSCLSGRPRPAAPASPARTASHLSPK